jgi:hypothetical protein
MLPSMVDKNTPIATLSITHHLRADCGESDWVGVMVLLLGGVRVGYTGRSEN